MPDGEEHRKAVYGKPYARFDEGGLANGATVSLFNVKKMEPETTQPLAVPERHAGGEKLPRSRTSVKHRPRCL
jgi:hypothetical protein